MKLLHLDSSVLGDNSASRQLTRAIVDTWRSARPGLQVTYRDLAAQPLPHLSGASLARADAAENALNETALREFLSADVLVLGAPMYNFGVPSQLKAWIDRIAVAGKTFRYTASGPEGLALGKRAIVAISRGGIYPVGGAGEFVESYLRHVLGFLGITDVHFVRAEGLNISPEQRAKSLSAAEAGIPVPEALAA